jgi:DNA-binding beta-propeller fold protein YncE
MLAEAKSEDLLYISVGRAQYGELRVFSYRTGKRVGSIAGLDAPFGLCADKSGNVFVANFGAQNVLEYAHGGASPIATLTDPGASPEACASDPNTGNLAVVESSGSGPIVAV